MADEQEKYLNEAISQVKSEAFHMQRALDESNLKLALEHATSLISELKTSTLSPKTYYELYMQVFDNLNTLGQSFREEHSRGTKMSELYEKVQFIPQILPRLYLLITVGAMYMQTKEPASKVVLRDLIEMVKGVQHPVRGLFLRYYLNKMCKDKLPDLSSEDSGDSGDVTDSIDFLIQNLSEMNRLWVRMQHTGTVRDKTHREKERNDLRVTVGENIVRLSSLEGVNLDLYKSSVLPRVLEVVTASKDAISQQYLMDCIINAFPDGYHLNTLEPLLEASIQLQPSVDIQNIFVNLLTRLSDHAGECELQIVREIDIFRLFKNYIDQVVGQGDSSETKKLLQLQVAFMRLSLKAYPFSTENVNAILDTSLNIVQKQNPDGKLDADSLRALVKLLSYPLETLSLAILTMNYYPKLMNFLQFTSRKQVANKILETVLSSNKPLDSEQTTMQLLEFISPLLYDSADAGDAELNEFREEQQRVAKLVHLTKANEPDTYLRLLEIMGQAYAKGGPTRSQFTYPALIFAHIQLILHCSANEDMVHTVVKRAMELVQELVDPSPELAIKLSLQLLQALNLFISKENKLQALALELGNFALNVYQEELANSDSKFEAITLIAATLKTVKCFNEDNADILTMRCTQYATRQLKKTDQCAGVLCCAHMFWGENIKDEDRVVQCLKKAGTLATVSSRRARNLGLYVSILNSYFYFYGQKVPEIEVSDIGELIVVLNSKLQETAGDAELRGFLVEMRKYYENTLKYLKDKQAKGELTDISLN